MKEHTYEGVEIDTCQSCGGTWLDWGELTPIIRTYDKKFSFEERLQHLRQRGADRAPNLVLHCPKCSARLQRFQYAVSSGVFLDRCPEHGLWLDPGELDKIQIVMEELDHRFARRQDVQPAVHLDHKECPRCKVQLHVVEYEGVELDTCPSCKGYWCDRGELRQILKRREVKFTADDHPDIVASPTAACPSVRPEELARELPCVICGTVMKRHNYDHSSGIILDSCPHGHGTWLDDQELERVQLFVERWEEAKEEVAAQYLPKLAQIRAEVDAGEEDWIKSRQPSRLGFINRFMQALYKKGVL